MKLNVTDWNIIPYADAWTRQTEWFDALIRAKQAGEEYENHIILCEHPHVYTLGRSGKEGNMLLSEEQLQKIGATLYHIDRTTGMLSYPESRRILVGAERVCTFVGRSGHPCMCLLWHCCREIGESNRCLAGGRYAACA